jgi:hypothetical protein
MSAPTDRPCENFQPVISAIGVLYLYYTHKRRLGYRVDLFHMAKKSTKAEYLKIWESLLIHKSSKSLDSLTKTCPHQKHYVRSHINHRSINSYYSLDIQSIMLVFSTQLCELLPLLPSLWFNSDPPPLSLCQSRVKTDSVWFGTEWGVLSPVGDHILQG